MKTVPPALASLIAMLLLASATPAALRRRPRRNRDARSREQGDRPQGYDRAVVQGRGRCKDRVVLPARAVAADPDRAQCRSAALPRKQPLSSSRMAIGDRDFRKVGLPSNWSKPDMWSSPRPIRERPATIRRVAGRYRLWDRSRDVSFALDEVLKQPKWAALIDETRIGFVGHSFGGWTGVSLAGGRYDPGQQRAFCEKSLEERTSIATAR